MASGFVLLDKPSGITSRQAGGRVAKIFGAKKFGHVGTLDPMASGLLVIALGEATKMIPYLDMEEVRGRKEEVKRNMENGKGRGGKNTLASSFLPLPSSLAKEYLFSIKWGIRTDTEDTTGKIIEQNGRVPEKGEIAAVLPKMIGAYDQAPPAYSAKKIGGVPAYKLARRGAHVAPPPKTVEILELEMTAAESEVSQVDGIVYKVACSAGTYVRSLARDIAEALGGNYMAACSMIRRTRANGFEISGAARLDLLEDLRGQHAAETQIGGGGTSPLDFLENIYNNSAGTVAEHLRPMDFGLDGIPVAKLKTEEAELFANGGFVSEFIIQDSGFENAGLVRVCSDKGFIGIGVVENDSRAPDSGFRLKPKRIINVEG